MNAALRGIRRLLDVMARLRDPDGGCPWDREQTPASVAPFTIEEACELAQAAESGGVDDYREELGDLLFNVIFHARMAEEAGWFDFDRVAAAAADKLVQRHPHVLGDGRVSAETATGPRWEAAKAARRKTIDDGLPPHLPALMAARKLQGRAAAVGFDWPSRAGAAAKIAEETAEVEEAAATGVGLHEEVGDLLFAVVNLARHVGVEPEQALRSANRKFTRRFRYIEARLAQAGLRPEEAGLEQLDALWEEAKRGEREAPAAE